MIKKTITFEGFDGKDVSEDHYFHMTKRELIEWDHETPGGLEKVLTDLTKSNEGYQILAMFTDIIRRSYGRRDSLSNSRFIKDPDEQRDFLNSQAFDALLTEMLTDGAAAAEFVNGLIPKDLADMPDVRKAFAQVPVGPAFSSQDIPGPSPEEAGITHVPDPNNLDGPQGTWPRGNDVQEMSVRNAQQSTGLEFPFDADGNLWPWAHREPSNRELMNMHKRQLMDVHNRHNAGWKWKPSIGG